METHSPLPWTDNGYIFDDHAKMHREILDANGEIVCGRDKIMSRHDLQLMLNAVNSLTINNKQERSITNANQSH